MRTPTTSLRVTGLLAVSAALLLGCGGGSDSPAQTEAEIALGTALLPSDGVITAADALSASDLPPDGSTSAVVDDEDMPPSA